MPFNSILHNSMKGAVVLGIACLMFQVAAVHSYACVNFQKITLPCTVGGTRQCTFHTPYYNNGGCVAYQQCASGHFMHREALVDSGGYLIHSQICRPYTVCAATEYKEYDGTVSERRDNVCVPYTAECGAEEYEAIQPSSTRDRACKRLKTCLESEYESLAPTATTDRNCTPRTLCIQGEEFVSNDYNPTEDDVCQAYQLCASGSGVSSPGTERLDRACEVCAAGQYGAGNSTPCQDCLPGTFSAQNAASCTPHSTCEIYAFLGNSTADAMCLEGACPSSWRLDETTKLCSRCKDGYFINENNDCEECPEHHYCPPYSLKKVECSNVKSLVYGSGNVISIPYSPTKSTEPADCSCKIPGFHGVSESIQGCQRCRDGTYSNETTDGCVACPDGWYIETETIEIDSQSMDINVGCLKCPDSAPYTHGAAHSEAECKAYSYCEASLYWDDDNKQCQPCTDCGDLRLLQPCTNQGDTQCGACSPVSYLRACQSPGFVLPRCEEDGCVPCVEEKPGNSSWVATTPPTCLWRCDAGFYEVLGASPPQCAPCSDECIKAGLIRVPCSARSDASCGSPCKNLSKPLLWSTWVATEASNCEWECVENRTISLSEETGIYTCSPS